MKTRFLYIASLIATVAACGSEEPAAPAPTPQPTAPPTSTGTSPPVPAPPPPPGSTGKSYFVDTVYPSLAATCGNCHIGALNGAPPWLTSDANSSYDIVKSYKNGILAAPAATNGLLLREPHAGGQQLNNQQKGLVEQWLLLEGSEQPDPGKDLSEALELFVGCMDLERFIDEGLDQIPNTEVTSDIGPVTCADANCHGVDPDLAGGILLNNDVQATFDNFKIFPAILKLVNANSFPFQTLVNSERLIQKGGEYENCRLNADLLQIVIDNDLKNPDYCHPTYSFDDILEDTLNDFIEETIAISNIKNCALEGI